MGAKSAGALFLERKKEKKERKFRNFFDYFNFEKLPAHPGCDHYSFPLIMRMILEIKTFFRICFHSICI